MNRIKSFIWAIATLMYTTVFSQNKVGIGVTNPTQSLSVAKGMNIDHDNENTGTGLLNGLLFGNTGNNTQMVGISSNRAGSSPYTLDFYTSNIRRMIITQSGMVGINTVPTGYYLEVGGTVKGINVRADNSVISEGIITAYDNITTTFGNIVATIGDISAPSGELKAGGKGVVMSNTATRQKVVTYTATLSASGLPAGGTVTGLLTITPGTFSGTPTAYVGNVVNENGDYYKALIVLENVTTSSVTVRVVNPTSSPISFSNATWKVLVVGPF